MDLIPKIMRELTTRALLDAYMRGAFPMVERGRLLWFSPAYRGLLPLDERFHVPRRLGRTVRGGRFVCTVDRRFPEVMGLCAAGREGGTWISPEMRAVYGLLHAGGVAHSVEAWPAEAVGAGEPAGGLYGLAIGGAFFAESMFHRATDAGKVALVFLVERLREREYLFCDVQWTTPHLRRFGAFDLPRDEYLRLLSGALEQKCQFV